MEINRKIIKSNIPRFYTTTTIYSCINKKSSKATITKMQKKGDNK